MVCHGCAGFSPPPASAVGRCCDPTPVFTCAPLLPHHPRCPPGNHAPAAVVFNVDYRLGDGGAMWDEQSTVCGAASSKPDGSNARYHAFPLFFTCDAFPVQSTEREILIGAGNKACLRAYGLKKPAVVRAE